MNANASLIPKLVALAIVACVPLSGESFYIEIVGKVLKWGPEANSAGLKVGDHMIVFPWVGCGKCD